MTNPEVRSAIKLVSAKLVNMRFIADIKSSNFYRSNIMSFDYHFVPFNI